MHMSLAITKPLFSNFEGIGIEAIKIHIVAQRSCLSYYFPVLSVKLLD